MAPSFSPALHPRRKREAMRKDCSKRDLHTPTAQLHPCPTLAKADSLGAQKTAQTNHPLASYSNVSGHPRKPGKELGCESSQSRKRVFASPKRVSLPPPPPACQNTCLRIAGSGRKEEYEFQSTARVKPTNKTQSLLFIMQITSFRISPQPPFGS